VPSRLQTKSSTPRLSEVARHVVAPADVASTGWPAVRDKCADLGLSFRVWQHGAGRLILAKRADGKYAATIGGTGMSIPRQVGKTFLVAAIAFALCLLRPGLTVIWTAHRLRTAEETFGKMQAFAKRRKIAPHVVRVVRGSGEEAILFANGSRIMFGARERGFGRGFDEVDVLIFDEAQILGESALDDMVPATNQSRQDAGALLLFLGTPPKPTDNGEVFTRMRSEALSGEDSDTGWIEFGADPGFNPTPLPAPLSKADWQQVAKANPSFPDDTPREAILRMRKKLGPDSFLREGLGIWDDHSVDPDYLDVEAWLALTDAGQIERVVAFAVESDLSHAYVSVSLAGERADGMTQVELVEPRRRGTTWVVDRAVELDGRHGPAVWVIDGRGPARDLIPELEDAGLEVVTASTDDVSQAYTRFVDGLRDGTLRHGPDEVLLDAVKVAKRRPCGDNGYTFGRRVSGADISPVQSCALAHWAAVTRPAIDILQTIW
jgi:hypothetical protein